MSTREQTRTRVRPAGPPRVDLLPPEIGERRRLRRVQTGLGGGVLVALGLVAAAYLLAAASAGRAGRDLEGAQAEQARLQVDVARYAAVPTVYGQVDQARAARSSAMAQEVRWSAYLDDLTRTVPSRVWLTSVTASLSGTAGAAPAGTAPSAPSAPSAPAGLGRVQFNGRAFSHDDLAAFLVALESQKGNASPYFSSSTKKGEAGGIVEFAATVELDQEALSGRFRADPGGR